MPGAAVVDVMFPLVDSVVWPETVEPIGLFVEVVAIAVEAPDAVDDIV